MGTTSYLGPEEDSEHVSALSLLLFFGSDTITPQQQGYPFEHSADANDDDDDDDDEG